MVSSFRLTDADEKLLDLASKRTGKSRSELVRAAVQSYCRNLVSGPKRSLLDRLTDSGFKPEKGRYTNLSSNKTLQRKLLSEKFGQTVD